MRLTTFAVAILVVALSSPTSAQTVDEKKCIVASAQKLPSIGGSNAIASRVTRLADDASNTPGWTKFAVQIDVKVAGQDITFGFVCGTSQKGTIAEPLGITQ